MDEGIKVRIDSLYHALSILANGAYTYVTHIESNWTRWSKEAVDYFDLPDEYMQDALTCWMKKIHPEDLPGFKERAKNLFKDAGNYHNEQYRIKNKGGKYVVCTCRGVVLCDEHGKPSFFGGIVRNNDALSYFDDVSNTRSLYGFMDDLRSSTWKGEKLQVMMLGIADFSHLNEIYGYTFGNRVL